MIDLTTADVVKANCVAALQAAEQLTGVEVMYGWPGETKPAEGLYLGDIIWEDTDWQSLGGVGDDSREERYTIDLVIGAKADGATQQTASQRCFELLKATVDVLTGNDTILGPPGWLIVKPRRLREGTIDQSRAADLNAGIYVYAYLR